MAEKLKRPGDGRAAPLVGTCIPYLPSGSLAVRRAVVAPRGLILFDVSIGGRALPFLHPRRQLSIIPDWQLLLDIFFKL